MDGLATQATSPQENIRTMAAEDSGCAEAGTASRRRVDMPPLRFVQFSPLYLYFVETYFDALNPIIEFDRN